MKRLLLLAFLVIAMLALQAGVITESIARKVAINWINNNSPSAFNNEDIHQVNITYSNKIPLIYVVIFKPLGWVMVSATDNAEPVLGYSVNSVFDIENMPVQLEGWLEGIGNEIESSLMPGYVPGSAVLNKWEDLRSDEYQPLPLKSTYATSAGPLLTSKWNQGRYYNEMAPYAANSTAGNGHVWIGCVATAMAQLMNYWEFPNTGLGSHSYDHATYGLQSANFEETNYNWSVMPDQPVSENIEIQKINYHSAVAVNMNFSPYASGASLEDARDALFQYFKYNNTVYYPLKNEWDSEAEWKTQLKTEIDKGQPVIYAGIDPEGGHAFICDGYTNDFFHFNWGWGGYADGNYLLSALTPGSSDYTYNQSALFGIEPITAQSIPSPYSEGFEMGNEGLFNLYGMAGVSTLEKHAGTYSLRLSKPSFSSYSKNSAILTFVVPTDGHLSFWVKRHTLTVSIKNQQQAFLMPQFGATALVQFFNGDYEDNDWVNYTLDISQYAGQVVRLMFVQQNFDLSREQWMYIDNVSITGIYQNLPPFAPSDPYPSDTATTVEHAPVLKWSGGDMNGDAVTYSVYFGTTENPPLLATVSTNQYSPGTLNHSTRYYWKIISSDGELQAEGPLWTFKTRGIPPDVGFCGITEITSNTADACGTIIDDHGAIISSKGICWNFSGYPTLDDNFVASADSGASFTGELSGLLPFTTYYARAYAVSNEGIAYSETVSFSTLAGLPEISSSGVIHSFRSHATLSGIITSINDSAIVNRGMVWSLSAGFITDNANWFKQEGYWSTEELFELQVDNLPGPDSVYYRLFAENSIGKSFSEEALLVLINTPPTIDLDADDSSGKNENDFMGEVLEQLSGGFITDNDVLISDIDSDTIQQVRILLTMQGDNAHEYLIYTGEHPGVGLVGNYSDTLILNNHGSLDNADWQNILRDVEFYVGNDAPNTELIREVTVEVSDGFDFSEKAIAFLKVIPVNDPPVCLEPPGIDTSPFLDTNISLINGNWVDQLDECTGVMTFFYQWQMKVNGEIINIENATNTSLLITEAMCGSEIRVVETVIDNHCGGANVATASAVSLWTPIGKLNQTITFDPIPVQYFSTQPLLLKGNATSGLPLTYTLNDSSKTFLVDIVADTVFFKSVGFAVIAGVQAGNDCFNPSAIQYRILTIEKGQQEIIADIDNIYTYRSEPLTLAVTLSSALEPVIESSAASVVDVVGNQLYFSGVGSANIIINQPGNDNYHPAQELIIPIEVIKNNQTVEFNLDKELRYGDGLVDYHISASSGLDALVASIDTSIIEILNDSLLIKGVGAAMLHVSNTGNDVWNEIDTLFVVDVHKGVPVLNAPHSITKYYNDEPFYIEAWLSSALPLHFNIENKSVANENEGLITIQGAGETGINVFHNGNEWWEAVEQTINLVVLKGIQTISFGSLPQVHYGSDPIELSAISSSGLEVNFESQDTTIAVVDNGNQLRVVSAGETNIVASQEGNANWEASLPAVQILVVEKAGQTVTSLLPDTLYVGEKFHVNSFTTSSGLAVSELVGSDHTIVKITNDSILFVGQGQASVEVIQWGNHNYLPVSETFSFTVVAPVGIFSFEQAVFGLYPNPATDVVYFTVKGNVLYPFNLSIINALGQVIKTCEINQSIHTIDLSSMLPGFYLVYIQKGNEYKMDKLIIK